ncbi:MAG TPA: hypothetical protein VMI54_24810 [Polyangiaceae bacterium]|nr:hypothetical protein [Polyangiaceae bacterium]
MPADKLRVNLITPNLAPDGVGYLLAALETEPLLTPSHASLDERKRVPYSPDSARQLAATRPVVLWRTTKPRYDGMLMTKRRANDGLKLNIEPAPNGDELATLFEAVSRVVSRVPLEFGLVHAYFTSGPDVPDYNRGAHIKGQELDAGGLTNLHARTWFGPYVTQLIGKELLLSLPNSLELASGVIQLDLAREPWAADFTTLSARQSEIRTSFESTGVLAKRGEKSSPRWVSPGWHALKQN